MSLYPPSQAYSQVGYSHPPQGYLQPPPPPPAYPPFQPQAVFYADPNHFRRDYAQRLAQLTFNSRPHIQSLSMIAQDYTRYADIVVQSVEQHIRRVPPWMKLPAFYLLDAMSKNVFDPYARLFAPIVLRLFLDTYHSVDQATRHKMEEMLGTWRTGAPNGRELFGVVAQVGIEREIWGSDSTQSVNSRQDPISPAHVLNELEAILGNKERTLQTNPYDKQTQTHVQVLQQLRKLVQAGVQQDELGQILTQLRTLGPAVPPVAPVPPVVPSIQHNYPPASASYSQYPTVSQHPAAPVSVYPPQPSYATTSAKTEPTEIAIVSAPQAPAATASATPAVLPVNVSSLFNKILQTGVLSASASSTPTGAGATAQGEDFAPAPEYPQETSEAYEESVLASASRLTSVDILKQQPPITKFLYENLSSQCKQCGVRFGGDAAGKKKLEDHLDIHFRQNRDASQTQGRGYGRVWFASIDDWLNDGVVDVKGKRRAGGPRSTAKAVAAEEAAERDAELRSMTVVVPPGQEATAISCPICKEHLKLEFNEDDEEWVWRNAVRKDDRIYHATCHAEAMSSKTTLATRLRTETSSRSRSQTPEFIRSPPRGTVPLPEDLMKSGSPSPSKLAGLKRKVEEEGTPSRELTPPYKKLALSVA